MDAVVVWIAEGGASAPSPAAAPDDEAARSLDAWAHAHGVTLVLPPGGAPAKSLDWGASAAVERALEGARDALTGLDFASAEEKLGEAATTLQLHPELPNAAWLRAEVDRTWSSRWLRGNDEARARKAWQRASALDGGRAAGLGEKAFEDAPLVTVMVRLDGDPGDLELRLDGKAILPGEVRRSEAEHALALVRSDGGVVWASWVALTPTAVVRAPAPSPVPCTADDIKRVQLDGGHVAAPLVQCGHWVAAVAEASAPGSDGARSPAGGAPGSSTLRVSQCEAASCGPLVPWQAAPAPTTAQSPGHSPADPMVHAIEVHRAHWPAWATWTLIGVGVAGAAVGIAAGAGAFKSAPTETHFVNGGLQIRSF